MIYEAMLQVRDGGKKLFHGKMPSNQKDLNSEVLRVVDKKLENTGIDVKGFRLKIEAYVSGHVPDPSMEHSVDKILALVMGMSPKNKKIIIDALVDNLAHDADCWDQSKKVLKNVHKSKLPVEIAVEEIQKMFNVEA